MIQKLVNGLIGTKMEKSITKKYGNTIFLSSILPYIDAVHHFLTLQVRNGDDDQIGPCLGCKENLHEITLRLQLDLAQCSLR